jgi:hypothetical protein
MSAIRDKGTSPTLRAPRAGSSNGRASVYSTARNQERGFESLRELLPNQ